jgi:hypothetical protein
MHQTYSANVWRADYAGVAHREACDTLSPKLQAGCYWRFDWFRIADNPTVRLLNKEPTKIGKSHTP